MMRVELNGATGALSDYTRQARCAPVVITRRGKPLAILRTLTDQDRKDLVLSGNPAFLELMKREQGPRAVVRIQAVGVKDRSSVWIGGQEVKLG